MLNCELTTYLARSTLFWSDVMNEILQYYALRNDFELGEVCLYTCWSDNNIIEVVLVSVEEVTNS